MSINNTPLASVCDTTTVLYSLTHGDTAFITSATTNDLIDVERPFWLVDEPTEIRGFHVSIEKRNINTNTLTATSLVFALQSYNVQTTTWVTQRDNHIST